MTRREGRTFIISFIVVLSCIEVANIRVAASRQYVPEVTQATSQASASDPGKVPAQRTPCAKGEPVPTAPPTAREASLLASPLAAINATGRLGWLAPEARYKTQKGIPKVHLGVDFNPAYGEAIHAMADGQVVYLRTDVMNFGGDSMPGGGLVIKHCLSGGKILYALYGHLEQPSRSKMVTTGQVIGRVGHYYLVSGGQLVDEPPPSNPFLMFVNLRDVTCNGLIP